MPSEKDALSGEMKTLVSRWAVLTRLKSAKANALEASMTLCSERFSSRGRVVSGADCADGFVESGKHAARTAARMATAGRERQKVSTGPPARSESVHRDRGQTPN